MPGQDSDLVTERKDLFPDSAKEEVAVSPGQIPAANPACEEDVTTEQDALFLPKKAEVARGMPRDIKDLEFDSLQAGAFCLSSKY